MMMESSEVRIGSRRKMVATPWGDSDSLRERRLRPGPGTSPDEVKRNQRERLYGAMVAAVCSLGYEATRVADLVEISGVSSRSFYDLFENKEACFIATLNAILEPLAAVLTVAGEGDIDWDERVRRTSDTFAQLVAAQPATARFVITEAYAAGPVAWEALDRLMGAVEDMARLRCAQSEERAGMPDDLIAAQIGAVQEVTRTRLREGDADLAADLPELMDLMQAYRPPVEPLRLASRTSPSRPESIQGHDDSERALRAFALVVAEHGYGGATIHEIARSGAMSPTTFYANFRDKEDALLAAIDSVMAQMATAANTAFARSGDWASGVRAAIGAALNFLASRPAMAHLLTVDVFAGGDAAMRRRREASRPLRTLFAEGTFLAPQVPSIAVEAITGGIAALTRKRILDGGAEALPALAPVCTYFALAPFVGPRRATAAANSDRRGRLRTSNAPLPGVLLRVDPNKWTVLATIARWPATVEVMAVELDASPATIERAVDELAKDGLIEPMLPERPGDPERWQLLRTYRFYDLESWEKLTLEEREAMTRMLFRETAEDAERAFTSGYMNRRFDSHFSRIPVSVDEQGWEELTEIHRALLAASQAVNIESSRRLRESGERPIRGTDHQALFELPPDDWTPDSESPADDDPED